MSRDGPTDTYKFSTPHGITLCRNILISTLPFCPHDYQLSGVAAILDGHDLLAVSATGSGKTAYTYMTLHVIKAIQSNPELCPAAKFPMNAAILVVSPTTALEEDQEAKFRTLHLTAQAINSVTKEEAVKNDINIWKHVEEDTDVILLSPEMITSPGFGYLVNSKVFSDRLYAICFDEVHLLNSWGLSFRPDFQHIAYIRKRFIRSVVLYGTTATLRTGLPTNTILNFLGFDHGNYILQRRSNARPEVKLVVRTLDATQSSERFPQLDWILKATGKTLIFCPTIRYGFKLAVYFWHLDPHGAVLSGNVRLFNSLNSTEYNQTTLMLLQGNNRSKITVATDKLSVGVDIPDFQTVVIIDPKNMDDIIQKGGRVGRDVRMVQNAQVIIYFPKETVKAATKAVHALHDPTPQDQQLTEASIIPTRKRKHTSKRSEPASETTDETIEDILSMQHFIVADCKATEVDIQYGNQIDIPCSSHCLTCAETPPPTRPENGACICSGCNPELPNLSVPKPVRMKQPKVNLRVTKPMQILGIKLLQDFRDELYFNADERETGMTPLHLFFPDQTMHLIMDHFPTLLQKSVIQPFVESTSPDNHIAAQQLLVPFIHDNDFLVDRSHDILCTLWTIHTAFDRIREEKKLEQKAKREHKRGLRAGINTSNVLGGGNNDDVDSSEGNISA